MGKHRRRQSIPSESQYKEGYTELNYEQIELLKSISNVLNGYPDNYCNLPRSYAPEGLIELLRNQVKAKIDNGMVSENEGESAVELIDLLEIN